MTTDLTQLIERRAELMTELFLQELGPAFLTSTPADYGFDLLAGFANAEGGLNACAVQIKATDKPVKKHFLIERKQYDRLAHSNIPALIVVADVKENKLYYAWAEPALSNGESESRTLKIPVTELDSAAKENLHRKLAG